MGKSRRAGEPGDSGRASKAMLGFISVSYDDGPPHPLGPSALTVLRSHLADAGTFLGDSSHSDMSPVHYQ